MGVVLSYLQKWIVYNVGLAPISPLDLTLSQSQWVSRYNTEWHFEAIESVHAAVEVAIEYNWVRLINGDYEIGPIGETLWCKYFDPQWKNSFAFSMSGQAESYYIQVSASNPIALWRVVLADVCSFEYGLVDLDSIQLVKPTEFKPLYWKSLQGLTLKFVAQPVSKAISNFEYAKSVSKQIKWHLDLSERRSDWHAQ